MKLFVTRKHMRRIKQAHAATLFHFFNVDVEDVLYVLNGRACRECEKVKVMTTWYKR